MTNRCSDHSVSQTSELLKSLTLFWLRSACDEIESTQKTSVNKRTAKSEEEEEEAPAAEIFQFCLIKSTGKQTRTLLKDNEDK